MKWIAVDVDGVLCDFVGAIKLGLETDFGPQPFTYDDVTEWNFPALTKPECLKGGTIWPWLRENHHYWVEAPPIKGALDALELLSEDYYVELLTSKPDWARKVILEWCLIHEPTFDRLTIVGHNPARQTKSKKRDFSTSEILIDDSADNALDWIKSGKYCVLFDSPWNRDLNEADVPLIKRAKGWKQAVRLVRELVE